MTRWYVRIRGERRTEVAAALGDAGISTTGFSSEFGFGPGPGQPSFSVWVDASTAEEAMERTRSAVEGMPVYVDETSARLFDES